MRDSKDQVVKPFAAHLLGPYANDYDKIIAARTPSNLIGYLKKQGENTACCYSNHSRERTAVCFSVVGYSAHQSLLFLSLNKTAIVRDSCEGSVDMCPVIL